MSEESNVSYTTGEPPASRAKAAAAEVASTARESWDEIEQRYDLRGRIERHPFRSVALALGAGYLLGGGLFTGLTARLLVNGVRLGLRLAAVPLIRDELSALAGATSGHRSGGEI